MMNALLQFAHEGEEHAQTVVTATRQTHQSLANQALLGAGLGVLVLILVIVAVVYARRSGMLQRYRQNHPKRLKFATIGLCILAVIAAGVCLQQGIRYSQERALTCKTTGKRLAIDVSDGQFNTTNLTARRCDTLTIRNNGAAKHKIAFGTHDAHIAYGDYSETVVEPEHDIDIILSQPGTFLVHDHFNEEVAMTVVVAP